MNQTDFNLALEAKKKDCALDLLEATRAHLVRVARNLATLMAASAPDETITSVEVLAEMRKCGYSEQLDLVDPRFMGAVFRRGWQRVGYEPSGSHCRPVSRWKLRFD